MTPEGNKAFARRFLEGSASSEEATSYDEANAFHKFMRNLGATAPMAWLFARTLHHVDTPVYRLTKGRHTFGYGKSWWE